MGRGPAALIAEVHNTSSLIYINKRQEDVVPNINETGSYAIITGMWVIPDILVITDILS